MTRYQLRQFFTFVKLPYSEASDDLDELKKILLLELKSIGEILEINGKSWSKNDILHFFNSKLDKSLDLEVFLSDYPWIRNLDEIEKVSYNDSLTNIDFSDKRFVLYAQTEGKAKEEIFLRIFKNRILVQEDYSAVALLQYRHCFTSTFQSKLITVAQNLLLNRFNEIAELGKQHQAGLSKLTEKSKYLVSEGFYLLMKEVGNDNFLLLEKNLLSFYYAGMCFSYSTLLNIITDQLTLNHNEYAVERLIDFSHQINDKIKRVSAFEKEDSLKLKRRKHFFLLLAVIVVVLIIFPFINQKYTEYQLRNDPEFLKSLEDEIWIDSIANESDDKLESNGIDYRALVAEADSIFKIEQAKRPNKELTIEERGRILDSIIFAKKLKDL